MIPNELEPYELPEVLNKEEFIDINFTFDVYFTEGSKSLATRWDHYEFLSGEDNIHWMAIL
jgi:hypothetical protein